MSSFASPLAFSLLFPLVFCSWRMLRRTRSARAVRLPMAAALGAHTTFRQRLSWLAPVLFSAGLACGTVALTRPRKTLSASRETRNALAVEIAIDVSGSMAALDFATDQNQTRTRLDVVKETFREFVSKRPDDLIGLVAFGGYATTRCPLTSDHEALLSILDGVIIPGDDGEPVSEEETATAIGDGLAMACARLSAATNVASRIVLLLSDGENNHGIATPAEAAALATHEGIKVYSIGIGSNGRFPALWHGGGPARVVPLVARLDEKTLRKLAEMTGGKYFNARTDGALAAALSEIDTLEKTEIETVIRHHHEELFSPWLLACAALCCTSLIVGGASRRALL